MTASEANKIIKIKGEIFHENFNYMIPHSDEKHGAMEGFSCAWDYQQSKIKTLQKQVGILTEAMEFYADKENYTVLRDYKGLHNFVIIGNNPLQDNGDKARQALQKIKELNNEKENS